MIGRTREMAYPTITFSSREPGPRKKVKAHINQSTILDEYPGFITMDIDRPPGCRNSVVTTLGGLHESYSNSQKTQSQQISASVRSNNFMGTSIYLPGVPNLVATGGGLVQSRDKLFMASVAHPFEKHWNDRFPEEAPPGDYIFDIDEISDDEEDKERMVGITSGGSVTSNSTLCDASDCSLSIDNYSIPDNTQLQEGPAATTSPAIGVPADSTSLLDIPLSARAPSQRLGNVLGDTIDGELDGDGTARLAEPSATDIQISESLPLTVSLSGPAISSARGGTIGLDYSLFELPNSILEQRNSNAKQRPPVSIPREARSTEVIVHTASGPVAGRALATPSFLQPTQGMLPQQLWTVIMEGTLRKGLCGAWVVDESTGDVFGHIIAGAPEDGFAYMVPFYEIIDDLNLHFGDGWSLVDSGEMPFETTPGQVVPSQGRNLSPQNSHTLSENFAIDFSQTLKVLEQGKVCRLDEDGGGRLLKSEFASWLTRNSVTSAGDGGRTFIPQDRLRAYFTKTEKADNLKALLHATSKPSEEIVDVEVVRDSYLKIFSILIIINKAHYIKNFIDEGTSDSSLPLTYGDKRLKTQKNQSFCDSFCQAQWEFCPVSLDTCRNGKFDERQILPFMSKERISDGGSAKFYKVEIHPEHRGLFKQYQPEQVCSDQCSFVGVANSLAGV